MGHVDTVTCHVHGRVDILVRLLDETLTRAERTNWATLYTNRVSFSRQFLPYKTSPPEMSV